MSTKQNITNLTIQEMNIFWTTWNATNPLSRDKCCDVLWERLNNNRDWALKAVLFLQDYSQYFEFENNTLGRYAHSRILKNCRTFDDVIEIIKNYVDIPPINFDLDYIFLSNMCFEYLCDNDFIVEKILLTHKQTRAMIMKSVV